MAHTEEIKLILLDLDGTLLTSDKKLSPENYTALERAAQAGVHIVPCTGRFYGGMPDVIQQLPFVRYAITMNGAEILDTATQTVLHREEIPLPQAMELFDYLDTLPVIYDCYQGSVGWMDETLYSQIDAQIHEPHINHMVKTKRVPLADFRGHLLEQKLDIQKSQIYVADAVLRQTLLDTLPQRFPNLVITTSLPMNIEFNSPAAQKGHALEVLAQLLGIPQSQTMSFGDGNNDITMISAAGIGVAMANASPEVKAAADYITTSNDCHGVAAALEHFQVI